MSVLFYRRPDYLDKSKNPNEAAACLRYVERANKSVKSIPAGLTFDEVIQNKALPPCSLSDFMDYLIYVEHNAENLQFFLWIQDYERRFNELPEHERALSKEWISTDKPKEVPNLATKDTEKDATKSKRHSANNKFKDGGYDSKGAALFTEDREEVNVDDRHTSVSVFSDGKSIMTGSDVTAVPSMAEATASAGLKWQPFTVQPMREEVNRVMRHYLAFNSPRELNLSHKDRAQCLHALQNTTHPSAFKPALIIAEAALRGQSHPNFIRWSICNGNKPRVFFVRTMGVSHIAFGFIIALLLTLSHASRWWRILAFPMWFVGYSTMVAAYKGLCVIMHHSHTRNLRPWEQALDSEMGHSRPPSDSSQAHGDVQMAQMASKMGSQDDFGKGDDKSIFRSSTLQTFGPKNSFEDAQWVDSYKKRSFLSKMFEKNDVWTQEETLRILQDKIVMGAHLWGIILAFISTVVFTALPKGNFY